MKKYLHIISLSHSGSTLLSLLIGNHPKCISVGEVYNTFAKFSQQELYCSCGKNICECALWGKMVASYPYRDVEMAYLHFIDCFTHIYKDKILIDTSKTDYSIQRLAKQYVKNLRVILLIKDIRSYTFSQLNKQTQKIKIFRSLRVANHWYNKNKYFQQFLQQHKIPFIQIGYEELCFQPQFIMKEICDFVEIDFQPSVIKPSCFSHILSGNRMRYDPKKLQGIHYDYGWLSRQKSFLSDLCLLPYLEWNYLNVYSNHHRNLTNI